MRIFQSGPSSRVWHDESQIVAYEGIDVLRPKRLLEKALYDKFASILMQ